MSLDPLALLSVEFSSDTVRIPGFSCPVMILFTFQQQLELNALSVDVNSFIIGGGWLVSRLRVIR